MKPPVPGPIDKTLPAPDPAQVQVIRSYGPGHFLIGHSESLHGIHSGLVTLAPSTYRKP